MQGERKNHRTKTDSGPAPANGSRVAAGGAPRRPGRVAVATALVLAALGDSPELAPAGGRTLDAPQIRPPDASEVRGILRIRAVDEESRAPVGGVTVYVDPQDGLQDGPQDERQDKRVTTDDSGEAELAELHPGRDSVRLERSGYSSTDVPVDIEAGETAKVEVALARAPGEVDSREPPLGARFAGAPGAMQIALTLVPLAMFAHIGPAPAASAFGAAPAAGGSLASAETSAALQEEREHGEYLVHQVAMCHECHTPRDPDGALIDTELLQGAAMPVAAPPFAPRWGFRAPAIAGLPGYTDEEFIRLLTRGITQRGTTPRPPMPRYGFTEDDAQAILAYLRSL